MSEVQPAVHSLPLSPSSPPESGLKRQKRRLSDDNLPESPSSPPLMSVTANSYVSNYREARPANSDPAQLGGTDMQRQQSVTALPTPANSVAGSIKAENLEDGDQHRDKRQRMDTEEREANKQIIPGLSIKSTNHDRQGGGSGEHDQNEGTSSTHEGGSYGLFLPKTKYPKPIRLRPDPNEHLLSTYGLNQILQDVARIDPTSGDKINAMRKSYENQVKNFELAGLNKPVKKELQAPFNPGRLMTLYRTQPEKEGFEIDAEVKEKLKGAMQMQPGRVRRHEEWDRLLGHDKPKVLPPQPVQPVQPAAALRTNGLARPQATKLQHEPIRARRQGKRRRYDDGSFEGYGDGYVDADMTDSDDDGGSAKRKRGKIDYNDEY